MDRIKKLLKSETPLRWVFAGDSITHGALHTFGERDYVQIFEERVRWEMQRMRDVIIKTGVSGWLTDQLLDDIDWSILQFKPDVVSIMIGCNDSTRGFDGLDIFEANYNRILDIIANNTKAAVLLHTQNPMIPNCEPKREPYLKSYAEKIRDIASARGLPLIDHYAFYCKAWEENPVRVHTWMSDAIHPATMGHRAFARLMLQEMGAWDEKSMCCGVPIL